MTFSRLRLLLVALCVSPLGFAMDILTYPLPNLQQNIHTPIVKSANEATVIVFFQPNCPWCDKQVNLLEHVLNLCHAPISVALVGINGSKKALSREVRRFNTSLPALKADRQFTRAIGGIQATPVTLFFDQTGQLVASKRGLIDESLLAQAIQSLSNKPCSIANHNEN